MTETPGWSDAPRSPSAPPGGPGSRRLYREPDDRKLAGVCGGVADYLGVDATVIRILALVAGFVTGGMAALAYLLAALVVPKRPPDVPRDQSGEPPAVRLPAGLNRPVPPLAIAVACAIALAVGLTDAGPDWWFDVPLVAVALVGFGVWLLVRDQGGEDDVALQPPVPENSTAFGDVSATVWDRPAGSSGLLGERVTEQAEQLFEGDAPIDGDLVDQPATYGPLTSERVGPPSGVSPPVPPWWSDPSPSPAGQPATRHLGRSALVIALLLVVLGAAWILDMASIVDVDGAEMLALGLVVLGTGLVIAAWRGGARLLIALGLPAVAVLALADAIDVPLDAGVGDRTAEIDTIRELRDPAELLIGSLTVDMRDLRLPGSITPTAAANIGVGELEILVPPCATVEVDAELGVGELVVDDALGREGVEQGGCSDREVTSFTENGAGIHESFTMRGDEDGGRLRLEVDGGVGKVTIGRG